MTVERGGYRFDTGAGALPSTYADVLALIDALGCRSEVQLRGAVIGTLRDGIVHRIDRRNPLTALAARNIPLRDKFALWRLGLDLARMFRSLNYLDLGTPARSTPRPCTATAPGRSRPACGATCWSRSPGRCCWSSRSAPRWWTCSRPAAACWWPGTS